MVQSLSLVDAPSLGDLKVFLGRSARVENGAARLIGSLGVLAVYTPVLTPKGLLDSAPTVLGLRTFALASTTDLDAVVSTRALLDRLAMLSLSIDREGGHVEITLPPSETGVAWAGISPPRGGWRRVGTADPRRLEQTAKEGIAEIAEAVPAEVGEQVVHKLRSAVWSRVIPDLGARVPAAAAFAAYSLGFLRHDDEVAVFEASSWVRLSTSRGHVLVRW